MTLGTPWAVQRAWNPEALGPKIAVCDFAILRFCLMSVARSDLIFSMSVPRFAKLATPAP
jgi:hypothetical protein